MALHRVKVSQAAEKFARQGRFQEAIREYQRLLDDSPHDVGTLNKIGDLHRRAGHPERALTCYIRIAEHYRDRGFAQKSIAMFKKVAKLAPQDPEVREQLAGLYADTGLSREAQENLRDAARLLAAAGETERALELESRALELGPDDWAGLRVQAERLRDAGEMERSVAAFQRAAEGFASAGELQPALACCLAAMEAAPRDPEPAAMYTRLLLEADRAAEAVEHLQKLAAADPGAGHLSALLGRALLATGDRVAARQALDGARGSAFAAGDALVQADLVRLDLAEGAVDGAVETLERIMDVLEEQGAGATARSLLMECLQRQPESGRGLRLLLASCQRAAHGDEMVEEALDLLVQVLPGSELADALGDALGLLCRYRPQDRGLAGQLSALGGKAVQDQEPAPTATGLLLEPGGEDGSQVDQEFVQEHLTEADVFVKYGLLSKAVAQLEQIVQRFPCTVVAHQRLADLHRESGDRPAAVRHLLFAAEALRRQGAQEDARRIVGEAVSLDPDNDSLQVIRRALRQGEPLPAYQPAAGAPRREPAIVPAAPPPQTVAATAPGPTASARPPVPAVEEAGEEIIELLAADETEPPAEIPPPEPVKGGEESLQEDDAGDGFFDLAGAIEQELARETSMAAELPVVDDREDDPDPVTGIRQAIRQQVDAGDHQTHYQLGIAFKEMGMLDEAIGEFQQASRHQENFLACCSMLGLCFREKGMPQIAEKWYRRGLDQATAEDREGDHRLGLLYDLGELYLDQGRLQEAEQLLTEVYGQDATYREVAALLRRVGERRAPDGAPEARS